VDRAVIGVLQTYHTLAARELGHQRECTLPADGVVIQRLRANGYLFQDQSWTLGWRDVGDATVRAIDLHFQMHRLDRFQLTGVDGVSTMWVGYDGPPVYDASGPASYAVMVHVTSFPR
jgi:hypothetical protein